MKRLSYFSIIVATFALLFQSCASLRPLAQQVSEPDYNLRTTIAYPQYKKVPNAIGYVANVALPVAGAAAGTLVPAVVKFDPATGGTVPVKAANIALGGLVGLGVATVANGFSGYGDIVDARNHEQWVRKAFGREYIILADDENSIRIINPIAESTFIVKGKEDVEDFLKAFPGSSYSASVFDKAYDILPRSSYPWLIDSFKGQEFTMKAKKAYIESATSFSDLDEAMKLYGAETKLDTNPAKENLYFNLVRDCNTAIEFNKRFPASALSKKALGVALATNLTSSQINALQNSYGDAFNLTAKDLKELGGNTAQNYYQAMYTKAGVKNVNDYHKFVEQYAWIDFPGKKDEVLEKVWDFAYAKATDGKEAAYEVMDLYKKSYAKQLGIDEDYAHDWTIDKVARTIHDGISILNHSSQSSLSSDFGRWFTAEHTAGQIESKGEVKFVVWGEVKNSSKFSVPLDLVMSVDILKVHDVNLNAGRGLLGALASAGAAALGHKEELYQRIDDIVYSFPQLNSGETDYFAFVIDMGQGQMASGLNLGDRLKVASQLAVGTLNYTPKVRSGKPSQEQIDKQYEAMSIASHGLPKGKIIDLDNLSWLWGEGYSTLDQSYYDAEGEKIKAKEAAEEAARKEMEDFNHCTVHLYFKDGTDLSDESFVISDDSGIFFNESYTATTNSKGVAALRWPKGNGSITEIYISLKLFDHWDYNIKDLKLEDGGHYEILIDADRKK